MEMVDIYKIRLNGKITADLYINKDEEDIGCSNIDCADLDIICDKCYITRRKLAGTSFNIERIKNLIIE